MNVDQHTCDRPSSTSPVPPDHVILESTATTTASAGEDAHEDAMTRMIRCLQSCDPTLTELHFDRSIELNSDDQVTILSDALVSHILATNGSSESPSLTRTSAIRKVFVSSWIYQQFLQHISLMASIVRLFKILTNLPALQELHLYQDSADLYCIGPFWLRSWLDSFIWNEEQFKVLRFCYKSKFPTTITSDISSMLEKYENLEELQLTNFHVITDESDEMPPLALIFAALGRLTKLRSLEMDANPPLDGGDEIALIGPESIQIICRAGSLQRLALRSFGLTDGMVQILAEELTRNSSLEWIDIRNNKLLTCASSAAFYSVLQNQMYLTTVRIHFPSCCSVSRLYGDEDATKLNQETEDWYRKTSAMDIGTMLNPSKKALLAVWESKIMSMTRLNCAGRRQAFREANANQEQWIYLLAQVRYDVDALWHLLLKNPDLCQCSTRTTAPLAS